MITNEQKKKLLKAKIAVALHDELGRVPKKEEIENVFLLSRVQKLHQLQAVRKKSSAVSAALVVSEYDSEAFKEILIGIGTAISRSQKGCPWENGYQ